MNIYEGYYSPYQAFLFSEIKKAMIFFCSFLHDYVPSYLLFCFQNCFNNHKEKVRGCVILAMCGIGQKIQLPLRTNSVQIQNLPCTNHRSLTTFGFALSGTASELSPQLILALYSNVRYMLMDDQGSIS